MNLLLLSQEDLIEPGIAVISGRRYEHLAEILKIAERTGLCRAGLLNGRIGTGRLLEKDSAAKTITLAVEWTDDPPPPLPLTLVAALPRPQTFKKVIHAAVSMGVKKLCFIQTKKVEKSYWSSPVVSPESVQEHLLLGLEQAVDTVLPEVQYFRQFRPFAEDVLPVIAEGTQLLAAHPDPAGINCPVAAQEPVTLVVGPEGGFDEFEVELLKKSGARMVSLGSRILRTEVAVPVLLSRLFPF